MSAGIIIDELSSAEIIALFSLAPLDGEGGYFSPLQRDEFGNSIYFLMTPDQFSAWHRLNERETWTLLAGASMALHLRDEAGNYGRHELSRESGNLTVTVPPHTWMAGETLAGFKEGWSLVLCFLAPPFSSMELAARDEVDAWISQSPNLPRLIHKLDS